MNPTFSNLRCRYFVGCANQHRGSTRAASEQSQPGATRVLALCQALLKPIRSPARTLALCRVSQGRPLTIPMPRCHRLIMRALPLRRPERQA
jgi:hypothetical protein